ncbi:hypothetical protein M2418_002671 [Rhizobium sp. BIGb0125]|nr:hypothetical protein [Rhizobium sp. BIGb0125]
MLEVLYDRPDRNGTPAIPANVVTTMQYAGTSWFPVRAINAVITNWMEPPNKQTTTAYVTDIPVLRRFAGSAPVMAPKLAPPLTMARKGNALLSRKAPATYCGF